MEKKLNFFFQVSSKQKRMSNGRKEEVSKKTECNRCSRVCLRPIVNYLCLLFLFNFYICLFVFRRTFDTMASMANENEGFNPTEGSAIFNPEKDATTGDATKDAATAFNRGLEQLAAKQVRVQVDGYGEGVVKEFKKSRMFGASAHVVVFDQGGEQTVRRRPVSSLT